MSDVLVLNEDGRVIAIVSKPGPGLAASGARTVARALHPGARVGEMLQAPREAPTPLPSSGISVTLRGVVYALAPADALTLFGALAVAVDGETARVTLASGDTLELDHKDVSELGRQLAGKPADEVSG